MIRMRNGEALTVSRMSDWPGREERLPEQYSQLQRAVTDRLAVRIDYQTPAQPVSRRTVRPLAFYALGSRFYMNAYCERAQAERTFRLDRIAAYELVEK